MVLSSSFSRWYQDGKTFQWGDYPIFYQDQGDGEALVCLHGFPTASWDWHAIWGDLSKRYRVLAPDMLGFGYSAKPRSHRYSILEQADVYEQLLKQLGIDRFHILAHDIGDNVTLEVLARHQENPKFDIQSVCLLNGGIFPETLRPRLIQKLLLKPILGAMITRFYNRTIFGKQFSEVFGERSKPSADALDEFWALIEHNEGHRIIHQLMGYIPEGRHYRERWIGALLNNRLPIKFINGTDDPVSGKPMIDRLYELIPDANVSYLDGIGHYPHVESPDRMVSVYLEFLESLA